MLGQPGVPEEVRRKVLAAMKDAGATNLSREATKGTIGVVIPGSTDGDYIAEVVRGISESAASQGYAIAFFSERNSKEQELIRMLEPGGCDGIIAVVPNQYQRLLELCHTYDRHYVLVDYQGDELHEALTVEVQNRQSIVKVVQYLYTLGHRRIAFVTGMLKHASARQRLQGYKDALETLALPYDRALVTEGDWFHPLACELGQHLLALEERPTAVVASSDLMAFGVMQAAHQNGLAIGFDISITGFDDIAMAATVTPTLTTVRQPMLKIGEVAADLLLSTLDGKPIAQRHVQLETELVIRESTGRVRSED